MPHPGLSATLDRVRRAVAPEAPPDGRLLGRFARSRDEAAFAELVSRHGPAVWAVCRRVVGDRHLAEDAFQAAFLVLARKADRLAGWESVGGWLCQVARRVARNARRTAGRRSREVSLAGGGCEPPVARDPDPDDVGPIVLDELARLPDRFRVLLVLHYLGGHPQTEVAVRLGLPAGTVNRRMSEARAALGDRLRARGVAPALGGLAGLVGVPAGLSARAVAAGVSPDRVPAAVAALSTGVTRTVFLTKLKLLSAGGLLLAAVAGGLALAADPPKPAPAPAGAPKPAAKPPTFAGKLVLFPGQRAADRGTGNVGIFALNPDGTGLEEVVRVEGGGRLSGRVSPDGRRLAYGFQNRATDGWETWVLEAGGKPRRLAAGGEVWAWSPDGKALACRVMAPDRTFENFVVDVATGAKSPLELPPAVGVEDWSRGGRLSVMDLNPADVFEHPTKGRYPLRQIDAAAADGSGAKRLTPDPKYDNLWSRWSPDGTRLAHYQRRHAGGNVYEAVVVRKADGSDPVEAVRKDRIGPDLRPADDLPYPFHWDSSGPPCWSPDGKQVAVVVDNVRLFDGRVDDRVRFALVIAAADGKTFRGIDLKDLGLVYAASVDWR